MLFKWQQIITCIYYNTNSLKDSKVDELKLIFLDNNSTFNSISKIKHIEETLKIEKII